jgi:membrane-associated phospholipid phosphatase
MEIPTPLSDLAEKAEAADVAVGERLTIPKDEPLAKGADKVGKLGDQGPLYAVATVLILGGWASRDRRLAGAGVAMLGAVAAADGGKTLAKHSVSRTRPHVLLEGHNYKAKAGGSEEKSEQSFPSGHVAGCVAAARAIHRAYPEAGHGLTIATLIIAAARLVKGAHWPLDVAAGAVIGWAAEAVTNRLLRALGMPIAR